MRVVLMSKVSIKKAAAELDELSEEERRALRISRFHAEQLQPRASTSSNQPQPRYLADSVITSYSGFVCRVFGRRGRICHSKSNRFRV